MLTGGRLFPLWRTSSCLHRSRYGFQEDTNEHTQKELGVFTVNQRTVEFIFFTTFNNNNNKRKYFYK